MRVTGEERIPLCVAPSDQVTDHGAVPVSVALIVTGTPAHAVPPPETVAVGSELMRAVRIRLPSAM